MNKLTIEQITAHIQSTKCIGELPLDELHSSIDDINVKTIPFWTDAYMVFKHPQGGEIYSHLYLDCEVCEEKGVSVSLNNDPLNLRLFDIVMIENGKETQHDDLLSSHSEQFEGLSHLFDATHENFDKAQHDEFIAQFEKSILDLMGGKVDLNLFRPMLDKCAA